MTSVDIFAERKNCLQYTYVYIFCLYFVAKLKFQVKPRAVFIFKFSPTRSASTSARTVSPVSVEMSVANCTRVPSSLLSLPCPAKMLLTHLDAPAPPVPFASTTPSLCSSVLGPAFAAPGPSSSSDLTDCEGKGLSLSEDLEPLYSDREPFVCFCWPSL